MPSYSSIFALILIILKGYAIHAQEIKSDWKLSKESDDIKISYRFVKVGDTLKTREMKISFRIKSTPEQLVSMFRESDNLITWSAGIKKCERLENTNNTWLMYNLYNIPWPFIQKDLITKYKLVKSATSTTLYMTSNPNKLPRYPDVSRLENYKAKWVFKTDSTGLTYVDFYSISFTKPLVPRFIQDPIIQRAFIDSVNKLKALVNS